MIITEYLTQKLQEYVSEKYSISDFNFEIIKTKKEFDGFYTVVLFPLIPRIKKSAKEISYEIVDFIKANASLAGPIFIIQTNLREKVIDAKFWVERANHRSSSKFSSFRDIT